MAMSDDQDKVLYVSLDFDMVYYRHEDNPEAFLVKMKGHEWSILWWMYRLSERHCKFTEYLAEYVIPVCRRYFIDERKKKKENPEETE